MYQYILAASQLSPGRMPAVEFATLVLSQSLVASPRLTHAYWPRHREREYQFCFSIPACAVCDLFAAAPQLATLAAALPPKALRIMSFRRMRACPTVLHPLLSKIRHTPDGEPTATRRHSQVPLRLLGLHLFDVRIRIVFMAVIL
ncbi:hypothetical protein C8J57DRAFT_1263476 [Mycena rebaudengoi]|nr:hypothetical protein C8J57DRAFT_1263476 [Mycena rebaudengoi]